MASAVGCFDAELTPAREAHHGEQTPGLFADRSTTNVVGGNCADELQDVCTHEIELVVPVALRRVAGELRRWEHVDEPAMAGVNGSRRLL